MDSKESAPKSIPANWKKIGRTNIYVCLEKCSRNCKIKREGSAPKTCVENGPVISSGGSAMIISFNNDEIRNSINKLIS